MQHAGTKTFCIFHIAIIRRVENEDIAVCGKSSSAWLSIVGIGEDGWEGLSSAGKSAVSSANVLYGSSRHLALAPQTQALRKAWPSPMLPAIEEVIAEYGGRSNVAILASGDPLLYGVGNVFARRLRPSEFQVIPQVSAFSLACARLKWPGADTFLVTLVNRPIEQLNRYLQPNQQLIVYSQSGESPAMIAAHLHASGYGRSALTVFEHLGGPKEKQYEGVAKAWPVRRHADLNVVAVTCLADPGAAAFATVPGLPESAFQTDGQITKREVRAATLARLMPLPGEVLWDVGAGSGSIGIEWMRVHPRNRAIAFERREDRARNIITNANQLGVPGLDVIVGSAPSLFRDVDPPDAIFIGGGISTDGMVEACWEKLRHGGRLVSNTVTISGEATLARWQSELGGDLTRIAISRSEFIGNVLGWRAATPVTQWAVSK